MFLFEYDSSSSMTAFHPDLLHLNPSSEPYLDPPLLINLNTDPEMLDLSSVSLFSTLWNLFKTKNSNAILMNPSPHHVKTSDRLSPATIAAGRGIDIQELSSCDLVQQQSDRESSYNNTAVLSFEPMHHSVLNPVITDITTFEDGHKSSITPVGSPSMSLPRIDLTTVRSNDTLVHTFPPSLRATSGEGHHFGHSPYSNTQSGGVISGNQLNSLSKSTCAICMDSINNPSDLIKLPCHHLFHAERCIIPWIERNASCPVCRHKLINVDPLFRDHNSTLPDHLYHAYLQTIFKSNHSLSNQLSSSNPSTYSRLPSNDSAVMTATIWDSYSRFMM
ncbi:hypothetical protein DFH28DRAFT_1077417 [Melampsora americana]|nr:hypothetical protein DFH28DRAFT_1077417 [Melampsora americana]